MNKLDNAVFGVVVGLDGQFRVYNLQQLNELCKSAVSNGKKWKGTITFSQVSNTNLQGLINLYNWWLRIMQEDTGMLTEEIDHILRDAYLSTVKSFPKIGSRRIIKALEDLNFNEFREYLSKVHHFAQMELGIDNLPVANLKFSL